MNNLNTIFFVGPQGSGKGTQAKMLAKRLGFFHWDMGAILREVAASGTVLGIRIKQLIDSGVLLTEEDLYQVVKLKLNEIPSHNGVIFDGIPRRIAQAEFLLEYLKSQGRKDFSTISINISEAESLKRLLKRGEIEKRADDTEDKIKFRLKQYEEAIVPVIDFLKTNTDFIEIDGSPSADEVAHKINDALELNKRQKYVI